MTDGVVNEVQKFRDILIESLGKGEVQVIFTKKDGTIREMLCTTKSDIIPVEKHGKNSGRAKSTEAVAVFDIELQEWRSFRLDSVKAFSILYGNPI